MNFIFTKKPKSPQELVKNTRDAIIKLETTGDKRKVFFLFFYFSYYTFFIQFSFIYII